MPLRIVYRTIQHPTFQRPETPRTQQYTHLNKGGGGNRRGDRKCGEEGGAHMRQTIYVGKERCVIQLSLFFSKDKAEELSSLHILV